MARNLCSICALCLFCMYTASVKASNTADDRRSPPETISCGPAALYIGCGLLGVNIDMATLSQMAKRNGDGSCSMQELKSY